MDTIGEWLLLTTWWFLFLAYLLVLFQIVADLFRDRDFSGWWKAVWIVGLIALPLLSALVYVIARGRGMAQRQSSALVETKRQTDEYIRAAAGRSPAAEIAHAKDLLDQGVITPEEFGRLKSQTLA